MPGRPRKDTIDESQVGTYHCFNRCVRRAYLCGYDAITNKNYDYRKDWLRGMLIELAAIFAIDIFKYAVQDNHFHLILRNRPDVARRWTDRKVLRLALRLFPEKFRRLELYVEPHQPLPEMLVKDKAMIADMRRRLSSISWLMKVLEERIAKRANRQDEVTGAFWAGRFKCEALLDSAAVLCCALYVDLNLVRAGKSDTPERSKHTSAYDRIQGLKARLEKRRREGIAQDGWLCPLHTLGDYAGEDLVKEGMRATNEGLLEMLLTHYLELLDRAGRELRADKRGAIPADLGPILVRLGIDPDTFLDCIESYGEKPGRAVGSVEHLRAAAERQGRRWLQGLSWAEKFFTSPDAATTA